MTERNKIEFIKNMESLLKQTEEYSDIVIKYGYVNYFDDECYKGTTKKMFHESSEVVSGMGQDECVLIKWKSQHDMFGIRQSIKMDSFSGIFHDISKAIKGL